MCNNIAVINVCIIRIIQCIYYTYVCIIRIIQCMYYTYYTIESYFKDLFHFVTHLKKIKNPHKKMNILKFGVKIRGKEMMHVK